MSLKSVNYEVRLLDPYGNLLRVVDNFSTLEYTKTANVPGSLTLTLPDTYDRTRRLWLFDQFNRPDSQIQVWRSVGGGAEYLDMSTVWFINLAERKLMADGAANFVIQASDGIDLLRRRRVLYPAGNASAAVNTAADNALKAIFTANFGSGAVASRRLSAVQVQPNLTLGPTVAKEFAWRNALVVMQEIAQASATAASNPRYLAFDVVYVSPGVLEFQTYIDYRGKDHRYPSSPNPVILDPEQGNLADVKLTYDYRDEVNYVVAGGQGTGTARVTAFSQDAARIAQSPYRLIEDFVDARNDSTTAAIQAEADYALRDGRPRRILTGKLIQTPGCQYGVHYGFGDAVTVNYQNSKFNARLDTITVRFQNGLETVESPIRADEVL